MKEKERERKRETEQESEREREPVRERERMCVCFCAGVCEYVCVHDSMGWLRLVGSLKSYVSFAKEPYTRDEILQKRSKILRNLLIVATP